MVLEATPAKVRCPICGDLAAKKTLLEIKEPDRFERSIGIGRNGYVRRWLECAGCGVALNVLPSEAARKLEQLRSAYYEVDFANSDISEKYRMVMALPPEKSDNDGRVKRILSYCRLWFGGAPHAKVLDIGAGTGVFLARIIEHVGAQWDCTALEPDPMAAAHLRRLGRFTVLETMFAAQPELTGYTLVTLNKVLEHIVDPLTTLRQVARALDARNGLVYVEVPDKLTANLRPPDDNILGSLHCHLYDPASLKRLMQEAGFRVLLVERVLEPSGKLTVYAFGTLPGALEGRALARA